MGGGIKKIKYLLVKLELFDTNVNETYHNSTYLSLPEIF